MSKKTLGLLSFAPLVLLVASFALVFAGILADVKNTVGVVVLGSIAILGTIASVVLVFVVMMCLLSWACKQTFFTYEELVTWGMLFYFFNLFIYPFFWWKYIRNWTEEMETGWVKWDAMSKDEARANAFLPLECLGIFICLFFVGTFFAKIIPIIDGIVTWLLIILLGALLIYTIQIEVKFLIEVAKVPFLTNFKKGMWAFFFYTCVFVAFPVYWCIHMNNENDRLTRAERASIRKRNREFTRNKKREQREIRKEEKKEEYKQDIYDLSQSRVFAIFAILPGACLICAIILMVYWVSIYTGYDGPAYVLLCCMRVLLIGSGLIAWGMYMVSLWADERHTLKDKILWSISMTAFNVLLFPVYWNKYLRNKSKIQEENQRKHLFIISVLPVVLFAIFMILGNMSIEVVTGSIVCEVVFILATVFLLVCYLFSMLVFSVKVLDDVQLSIARKACWIVAFVLLGIISAPLYYWRYVFRGNSEVDA